MKWMILVFSLTGWNLFASPADDRKVVDGLFSQAQAALAAGKLDDAIALYEKVIEGHPDACDRWGAAQAGITQALSKKGDFEGAAKSEHLCLDAALDSSSFDAAVRQMANILSARDRNVDRANAFIAFEQSGGASNPLDAVGYPVNPHGRQPSRPCGSRPARIRWPRAFGR